MFFAAGCVAQATEDCCVTTLGKKVIAGQSPYSNAGLHALRFARSSSLLASVCVRLSVETVV
ncbi:hypothetical protein Poly59_00490 [Rubripirellula reticaptiva]|uniref:Uncharacterized protein n=1 Tax=Rubripirellula reticaptiva TaxID=2528013 RepID=A0A5C6F9N1_9BACT|nr:hypothetical protein Poly59_00490 [Rubripirellula reticaptiva]